MRNAFFSSFILFYFFPDKLAAQGEEELNQWLHLVGPHLGVYGGERLYKYKKRENPTVIGAAAQRHLFTGFFKLVTVAK